LLDITTGPVFVSLRGLHPALFESGVADDAAAHHTQIGRGLMDGELGVIPLNAGSVHTCHHTVTIRTQGQFGSGFVSVFIGLDVPTTSRILGLPAGRNTILVCNPRSVVDNIDGAGLSWASLSFPVADFQRAYRLLTHDEWPVSAPPTVIRQPDPRAVANLRATLEPFLAIARHRPTLLHDPKWRANAESNLQSAFLATLVGAPSCALTHGSTTPHRAHDIIHAVDSHLAVPGYGAVSVAELCDVTGTPRRTLERVFHETYTMGPADYVRRHALNAVRRSLLDEDGGAKSITDVAIAHGFWHLGRFSQQYRTLFGELPSETLRQRGRTNGPEITRLQASLAQRQPVKQKGRARSRETVHGLA